MVTDELIIQNYIKNHPELKENSVREVWRVLKEYLKYSAKKENNTRIKLSTDLTIFTDLYMKPRSQEYEGEELQYYMNRLYNSPSTKYDEDYLMNSKYKYNNLEEITEDVENFFKNPPFKNKKTKQ